MSMDKRSIYDGLNQLENELQNSLNNLAEMKQSLQEIVEKNATLELENQRLREHIRGRSARRIGQTRIVQIANEFGKDIRRRIPCLL